MTDLSEKALAHTRAVLAPTLDATAAILPWVSKTPALRFAPELNQRWQAACSALGEHWAARASAGATAIRPAVFRLLEAAIESGDVDCLHLGEMLASAADRLELEPPGARLSAALTACIEALGDSGGLENPLLASRARHFAQRLAAALQPSSKPGERSDVLDALFVEDADERLERMHEALDVLPIDIYALELESAELIQHAEQIEMWGILHLARQLQNFVLQLADANETVQDQAAQDIRQQLSLLDQALRAIDS